MPFRLAVIPGDGIGPTVVQSSQEIIKRLGEKFGISFEFLEAPAGDNALRKTGSALPESSFKTIAQADACLKGPVGESARDVVLPLRQRLDLFANLRPSSALPNVPCLDPRVDLIIVRENTECLYSATEYRAENFALSLRIISEKASRRIMQTACDIARTRKSKATIVHKANVLISDRLFRDVCHEVARNNSDIKVDEMYVDNAAYQLVKDPCRFDTIVTTNMFGDILSDEAAGVAGSLGLAPSANIGDNFGLFEPVHGSAPDISSEDANPVATIRSVAMMLDWLSRAKKAPSLKKASDTLQSAYRRVLEKRTALTPDLGGTSKCKDVTKAVIIEIDQSAI